MIIRNERKAIKRCLDSVKGIICFWVIVDTGSTDGTQALIQETLSDVPGILYERPWVDFATNRNEALRLAKPHAEYLLFIDADEELVFQQEALLPCLVCDCYFAVKRLASCESLALCIAKSALNWKWVGAIHEELVCEDIQSKQFLSCLEIHATQADGKRSLDANKFHKDLEVILCELKKDPLHPRYLTYLGITYEFLNEHLLSLEAFQKRAHLGGSEEEVFFALYRIAQLQRKLGMDPSIFIESYKKAYQARPSRIEPLYWLAHYYSSIQEFEKGYAMAKLGIDTPLPRGDVIYVETHLYRYALLLLFVRCSYQSEKYQETFDTLLRLKNTPDLPPENIPQVEDALSIITAKMNTLI